MDLEMENSGHTRRTMLSIIRVIGVNSYLVGPENSANATAVRNN